MLVTLGVTGCGRGGTATSVPARITATPPTTAPATGTPTSLPPTAPTGLPTSAPTSPLAAQIVPAGSTIWTPQGATAAPRPARVSVAGIGVRDAAIVEVGVDDRGALAVPGVREVGWYRFAARPGDAGSAVLAAHVAYDGVDGVFRRLADVRPGAVVTVGFEDGATRAFTVVTVTRIDKDELPPTLFSTTGPAQLVLITCGGAFDRERRSYEDNIVVVAQPT